MDFWRCTAVCVGQVLLYIRIRITMKLIDIEYMMMCLRIYPNLKLAWYAALFEKKKEGGPCVHLTVTLS